MYGTGTEDYVNDAWGMRRYVGPLSGDSLMGEWGVGPQIIGYRLHVADVFRSSAQGGHARARNREQLQGFTEASPTGISTRTSCAPRPRKRTGKNIGKST